MFCDTGRFEGSQRTDGNWYDRKTTTLWTAQQKNGCTPDPLTPNQIPTSVVVLGEREGIDTIQMCPTYLRLKAAAYAQIDAPPWWPANVDTGRDLTAFLRSRNLDRSDLEFDLATSLLRAFLQTSKSGGATNNLPPVADTYVNTWVWGITALPNDQRIQNAPNLALAARSAYLAESYRWWVRSPAVGHPEMRPPAPPPYYNPQPDTNDPPPNWEAPPLYQDPEPPPPAYPEAPE